MLDRGRMASLLAILIALIACLDSFAELREMGRDSAVTSEYQAVQMLSLQVRRMLANLLWLRVDDYLHASDLVIPNSAGGDMTKGGVSVRGSANELYPLARLVTTLDPSFITAGVVIGGLMMKEGRGSDAGSTFLRGLIRGNPDHPRLYALYAAIGMSKWARDDFLGAIPYLRRALDLFPRVEDADALARMGDAPRNAKDDLDYRGVVTRLAHSLVIVENYEDALKFWKLSNDFDPKNKVVKVLMMFRRMQLEGNVDRDELALYFQKLRREEQEESLRIGKEKAGGADPSGMTRPPPQRGLTKHAQPMLQVILDVGNGMTFKLGAMLAVTFLVLCLGSARGWLTR